MAGKTLTGFHFSWHPPLTRFNFALDRFAEHISNFLPLWAVYNEKFQKAMEEQFSTEGRYGLGRRWKGLTPRYAAWKQAHYPGKPIGELTGALRESMTGGAGYAFESTPISASFGQESGPAIVYGRYFAKPRPVIRMSKTDALAWYKAAHLFTYAAAREMTVV
jgi:hypothetical protein